MKQRSTVAQAFVSRKIDEALTRAGLPVASPLRAMLDRDAEVSDNGRDAFVVVPRENCDLSLDERLQELKAEPVYRHHFPKDVPSVDKRDIRKLAENFEAVASGKIRVE